MPLDPILCVDDEPSNLAALRQILKDEYALAFARNGEEALRAAEKHRPALILLDVQMSDIDGYEVCRRLKRNPSTEGIPVIFVTSRSEILDEKAGFDAGGVDYITKPLFPMIVQARVRTHLSLVQVSELEKNCRAAIHMLGEAGHYNDTNTGVHIWRMAAYCGALADAAGWTQERRKLIELAAPMHDTGKIGIPDAVLKKPGPLDETEWAIMKAHSRIGHDILKKSDMPVFRLAAEIALNHHEKWNGGGYPRGIAGEDIPESARIVAIADVFDALTMKRPYKEAWPLDRSTATMKEETGTHFEPRLMRLFEDILPTMLALKAEWDTREAKPSRGSDGSPPI
jgi:putative two-component system response regulator